MFGLFCCCVAFCDTCFVTKRYKLFVTNKVVAGPFMNFLLLVTRNYGLVSMPSLFLRRFCNAAGASSSPRSQAAVFFDRAVQQCMFDLNDKDPGVVLRRRKTGFPKRASSLVFMTHEQYVQAQQKSWRHLLANLQAPPVLPARTLDPRVLSRDEALCDLLERELICVDISDSVTDRERLVVVRQPDGILRTGTSEERSRMIQLFRPVKTREVTMPAMFEPEHLKSLLDRQEYVFVLDRACVQFEPEDGDYVRVTSATYEHVDAARAYHLLQSTRHFGALVFYLAWHRKIDNLLFDFIDNDRIGCACTLVQMFNIIHNIDPDDLPAVNSSVVECENNDENAITNSAPVILNSSSKMPIKEALLCIRVIEKYIEQSSVKQSMLRMVMGNFCLLMGKRLDAASLQEVQKSA